MNPAQNKCFMTLNYPEQVQSAISYSTIIQGISYALCIINNEMSKIYDRYLTTIKYYTISQKNNLDIET